MREDKPETIAEYLPEWVELIRGTCLYVASVMGDLMQDDLTVVGGLVPALLVDQDSLPEGADPHPGTMDLDLGLKLALLEGERYREVSRRLREAGFVMDTNPDGNPTRQRWRIEAKQKEHAIVDFLIPPSLRADEPGRLRNIEQDFAAIITPGLELAFIDREQILVHGTTIRGEECTRKISVCGPGAFITLKALAFRNRGLPKDAYDLYYVTRNYGSGIEGVAGRFAPLLAHQGARDALTVLRDDFCDPNGIGAVRVASFVGQAADIDVRQDVAGFISRLVELCES